MLLNATCGSIRIQRPPYPSTSCVLIYPEKVICLPGKFSGMANVQVPKEGSPPVNSSTAAYFPLWGVMESSDCRYVLLLLFVHPTGMLFRTTSKSKLYAGWVVVDWQAPVRKVNSRMPIRAHFFMAIV